MSKFVQFSAIKSSESIDAEKGIIYGVSVMTEGQATGVNSGIWIDQVTLSQLHKVASTFPDGIKVKLSQAKEHDGSAGQIVGALKNFKNTGDRVRADFHLLKSSERRAQVLEMAETMPSEFGLSAVMPKSLENVSGKACLRCEDIYSVDLVESPAANKSGLFSTEPISENKTTMSKIIALSLGLPETATEQEIADGLKAALAANKPADLTALNAKIDEAKTELSALKSANANALALSQKSEIDNLMAEASRNGQVVPMDNDDLYLSKDGVVTINMLPTNLAKMISKLPKGVVKLSKKSAEAPKKSDGSLITDMTEKLAFASQKKEEGAIALTAHFRSLKQNFN